MKPFPLFWYFCKNTRRIFRAVSEETRRPLLPPEVEVKLRNRSPIAAQPNNNPTRFQFPPKRFALANVSNVAGGAAMIRVVVDGSRGDSVNNNGWNDGKECGCRDLVIAKNTIPEMRRDDRKGTFCEGCEICHGIIMT